MKIEPYHVYLTQWEDSELLYYNYLIPAEDKFTHYAILPTDGIFDGTIDEILAHPEDIYGTRTSNKYIEEAKQLIDLGEFHSQQAFENTYPELFI